MNFAKAQLLLKHFKKHFNEAKTDAAAIFGVVILAISVICGLVELFFYIFGFFVESKLTILFLIVPAFVATILCIITLILLVIDTISSYRDEQKAIISTLQR